jgi:hypothetical protein
VIVPLPSAEERKKILAENAARFPEAFDFKVYGDGGHLETLKLVIGLPVKDSGAWETAVAATFKPKSITSDNAALVMDCLVWPEPAAWGRIVQRWPALPDSVGVVVRRKLGGSLAMIEEPGALEQLPELVKEAQERVPGATWRRLRLDEKHVVDVAVRPPEPMVWQMFHEEMSKDGAQCWPLARDFGMASVAGASMPAGDLVTRWPGAALLIALTASRLGGLAAEVEKGEF